MQIGMLGPLEVRAASGDTVEVAGARLRALLIVLALAPGRVVSTARLVDGIWGERPPAGAVNALQALVSRLRRTLPEVPVESHPTGYRLDIEPSAVDVTRFERLVVGGRSASAEEAAVTLREALGLWRGQPLPEVAGSDFFLATAARLSELRLTAVEDRAAADLRLGRGGELITELTALVAEHPLRERLAAALMRALCAAGRSAEALVVYRRTREALSEALGTEPSAELSALHTAVLRGEPDLSPSTVDTVPRANLRAALTSFVGRDADVDQVGKLVDEYRLTTLTGPGGSGKTRLASEATRTLLDRTPGGVWLVELAPLASGADVPQAVLAALGVPEQPMLGRASTADRLVATLGTRNTLLVLDNCEHLIDDVAVLADRLLGECPRLRILATSREPLGITGEALWPVEPLDLPPRDADPTEAMSYAAVRLLGDRAAAASPGFAMTPAVVAICRALDGMPLAIELAAARLRTMTAEQLAARLGDRFRLLTGGSRVALPRHRTLRAVVDWSWELLSREEQAVLRRLAVFSGGTTVEAAELVCADQVVASGQVFDLLAALADKSLLVADGSRYRMLETIRAYCVERLDEAGERSRLRRAHATYFAELAETVDPHLRRAGQLGWLDRLAADHDNLTAALRGAIAAGDAPAAVRLVAAAGWYWWLGGHRTEGIELAAKALAVPGSVDDETHATACAMSAWLATSGLGDEHQADDWLRVTRELVARTECRHPLLRLIGSVAADSLLADEDPWVRGMARLTRARTFLTRGRGRTEAEADLGTALAEFRAIGERWGIAFSLASLADLVASRGELATAVAQYEEAVVVITALANSADAMQMRIRLAQLRWSHGDTAGAAATMAEAGREAERIGGPDALAVTAYAQADLARWGGDPHTARRHLARGEAIFEHTTGNTHFRAMTLSSLGYLDALAGDLDAARGHHGDALAWALRSGDAPLIGQMLVGVADLAWHLGNAHEAARLLAAGEAVRGAPDLSLPDAVRVDAAARTALGEQEFAEAARDGRAATIATVRDLVVTICPAGPGKGDNPPAARRP